MLLATGSLVAYGYLCEIFIAFYSGDTLRDRHDGRPLDRRLCAGLLGDDVSATCWRRRSCGRRSARRNARLLFGLSLVINLGMWMERVMIVVQSLHRDFLPSSWGLFVPTFWDWVFLLGSICTFVWLFLRLHPAAAGDLDLRDARAGAGERDE